MHSYFSLCYICYSSMWIIDCLVKYLWSHCIWYLSVIFFFHQQRSQRRARSFKHTALVISNIYRHLLMAQNSDRSTFFTLSAWLLALLWWYLVFARFVYRFLECIQMFASHLSEQNSDQPFFCTFLVFFFSICCCCCCSNTAMKWYIWIMSRMIRDTVWATNRAIKH